MKLEVNKSYYRNGDRREYIYKGLSESGNHLFESIDKSTDYRENSIIFTIIGCNQFFKETFEQENREAL